MRLSTAVFPLLTEGSCGIVLSVTEVNAHQVNLKSWESKVKSRESEVGIRNFVAMNGPLRRTSLTAINQTRNDFGNDDMENA